MDIRAVWPAEFWNLSLIHIFKAAGEPISIPSDMDRLLAAFAEKGITVE